MKEPSPTVLRLYVEGVLVDEQEARDGEESEQIALKQVLLVEAAQDDGKVWCAEIYEPDLDDAVAYQRFGTDRSMMRGPLEETSEQIGQRICGHYDKAWNKLGGA